MGISGLENWRLGRKCVDALMGGGIEYRILRLRSGQVSNKEYRIKKAGSPPPGYDIRGQATRG